MRSLVRHGWLSNEHGAWIMTVLPITVGICTVHPQPIQFLLLAAWIAAYCSYHALTLYMAAAPQRRKTYLPAMATWAAIAAACGIPVIILHPRPVARILIPVTIFCAIATFEAWRKRRRSLPSHLASVLASSCTYPLSVWVVAEDYSPLKLWCAAAAIAAYMLGATLYVRSLIRGAGDTRMFAVCIAWHLATLVAGLVGVVTHVIPLWSLIAFTVLSMRAIVVPALQNSSRIKLRPAVIGIGEYLACALMFSAVIAIVA